MHTTQYPPPLPFSLTHQKLKASKALIHSPSHQQLKVCHLAVAKYPCCVNGYSKSVIVIILDFQAKTCPCFSSPSGKLHLLTASLSSVIWFPKPTKFQLDCIKIYQICNCIPTLFAPVWLLVIVNNILSFVADICGTEKKKKRLGKHWTEEKITTTKIEYIFNIGYWQTIT